MAICAMILRAFNNGAKVQQWQKDNMWKEGETNSKYPRMFISSANNIKPSTYWLQDASYLRLKIFRSATLFHGKFLVIHSLTEYVFTFLPRTYSHSIK